MSYIAFPMLSRDGEVSMGNEQRLVVLTVSAEGPGRCVGRMHHGILDCFGDPSDSPLIFCHLGHFEVQLAF